MALNRRQVTLGTLASLVSSSGHAQSFQSIVDSAGRSISVPAQISKVYAAGAPASVAVYVLRPETLVGWPRRIYPEERPYVLPSVRDLPEVGLITGRGDTVNVERLLKEKPDLILDFGSVNSTYASLADSVQHRTGIPYALVDGRFQETATALRLMGKILGAFARAETLATYTETLLARVDAVVRSTPLDARPKVYLARGPNGLETGLEGSINTEIIERAGGRNVAVSGDQRRGIVNVSPEQVLLWSPEIVVTWDRTFFDRVTKEPDTVWKAVPAVINGRIYLAPTAPFGWIDRPPSLNRLVGLAWLGNIINGSRFPFDIRAETKAFYKLFYQVDLAPSDLDALIAWADGKAPTIAR